MRIIADNYDYYDCVQGMGQDKEVIYFRKQTPLPDSEKIPCINATNYNISFKYRYHNNPEFCFLKHYAVGFCGQVWPTLKVFHKNHYYMFGKGESDFFYDLDSVDQFMEENFKAKELEQYKNRNSKSKSLREKIKIFFEASVKKRNAYADFFEKHNVPVFTADFEGHDKTRLVLNGSLKDMQFYKIKDAYTAFQEIYMYLASKAVPQKPIPTIDDLTKAELKGFDKWSFRKEPSKK